MPKATWDQTEVSEARSFEVLPKGRYPCVINSCTEKKTQAGTGSYWEFELEIIKGDYARRKLWARLNINNPSATAQQIGREQYKALAVSATGKEQDDTDRLLGKYVVALVDIETGNKGPMNRVNGFMSPAAFKEQGGLPPGKPAAPAKTSTKQQQEEEDDIPF